MSPRGNEQNIQMRKDTLERITGGALGVFAEYGYYGTTMKRITADTGLSYGLVYHYFKSKEEIFSYLVNIALEKSQEIFCNALNRQGTAWERLTTLSGTLLEESLTGDSALFFHVVLQALTQGKSIPGMKENISQHSEVLFEKMIPILIQAQEAGDAASGDPVVLATSYMALVQGLALFHFQDEAISKKITPEILLNVLRR